MTLKSITPRPAGQSHTFRCEFDDRGRALSLEVTADELLSYSTFKLRAIERLGMVFHAEDAEARPAELADHFWQSYIGWHLRRAADDIAQGSAMN